MGFKILLADDSVTVQKIITLTFSDEGVDVLTVNNGDEAIHRLQYMRPALVMADVSIPGKNGYEICEYVKNHPEMKDTPVVLLVPAFEPFDEERARRIGADQHLTKPFQSIRTLITTVKTLIEGHPPKFATGSLNNPAPQIQVSEPVKAPVVESAPLATPVEVIRPTQPFPDEPAEETTPTIEAVETAEEPVVDIWKAEEVWEVEDVLDIAAEPVISALEPPTEIDEIEEIEPIVEEALPITEETQITEATESVEVAEPEPEPVLLTESVHEQITDAVTQANVKALDETPAIAAEPVLAVAPIEAPVIVEAVPTTGQRINTGDLDHVLDLDDVLNWPPAQPVAQPQLFVPAPPTFTPAPVETAIPQTVIDEIVNRVVAQLSEKLTAQLAAQLAPEVAELVKQQTQHEAVAVVATTKTDSDSLLDLD